MSPMQAADEQPDDERADARVDRQRRARRRWPRRPGWAGRARAATADDEPDDDADDERPDDPAGDDADREQDGRHRDREEQLARRGRRPSPSSRGPTPRRPSDRPMTRRKTAKMTRAKASAPSAATRPTSPAIAAASALARSMWAMTSAMSASRVAPICARRPGGGLRGPRGAWPGRRRPRAAAASTAAAGGGGSMGSSCRLGSSRVVLQSRSVAGVSRDDSSAVERPPTRGPSGRYAGRACRPRRRDAC